MLEVEFKEISIYDRFPILKNLEKENKIPNHVALILDGKEDGRKKYTAMSMH